MIIQDNSMWKSLTIQFFESFAWIFGDTKEAIRNREKYSSMRLHLIDLNWSPPRCKAVDNFCKYKNLIKSEKC